MNTPHIAWDEISQERFLRCDLVQDSDRTTRGPVSQILINRSTGVVEIRTDWEAEYNPVGMRWVMKTVFCDGDRGGLQIDSNHCYVEDCGTFFRIKDPSGKIAGFLVSHEHNQLERTEVL